MTMEIGDIIECMIDPVTDTDLFRFAGVAGEVVMLTLRDTTGGSGHPRAELYDPDQLPVESLIVNDGGTRFVYPIPTSGTYTVLLRENGDNQTATYVLGLQRIFPAPPESRDLCYDCIHEDTIDVFTDSDVFQFQGDAGSRIMLTLTDRTAGSGHPIVEVFDPLNLPLGDAIAINDSGRREILDLSMTGTYTVLVRENGDNQTANYVLGLQSLDPILPAVESLAYADVIQGQIDPVADSDVYVLEYRADTTILLTLTDTTGGSGHPIVEVFDATGQIIETLVNNDGAASWQPSFADEGSYVILIRENGDNQTATFNLGLQCIFGDCAKVPADSRAWSYLKGAFK
jgi:phage baseplate assembly protein gpV